jgi:hypothetical protein
MGTCGQSWAASGDPCQPTRATLADGRVAPHHTKRDGRGSPSHQRATAVQPQRHPSDGRWAATALPECPFRAWLYAQGPWRPVIGTTCMLINKTWTSRLTLVVPFGYTHRTPSAHRGGRHLRITGRGRGGQSTAVGLHRCSCKTSFQRALLGEDILRTARQAATADLLVRLAAAFLGAALMPALRPRPSDFAKSDRCAA